MFGLHIFNVCRQEIFDAAVLGNKVARNTSKVIHQVSDFFSVFEIEHNACYQHSILFTGGNAA